MAIAATLDTVGGHGSVTHRPASRRWSQLGAGLLLLGLLVPWQSGAALTELFAPVRPAGRVWLPEHNPLADVTSGTKRELVVIGTLAQARNDQLPLSRSPIERMHSFRGAQQAHTYSQALTCMTQAVYYEAGFEPAAGKRAVAQVVLNRMRHPAYPNSVCGVVYQGSNQRVCQFSFTCDGSLLRKPAAAAWALAQSVASAALAGYVERSVGSATHYHADYVLPRWAFELGKIGKIGAHIFYRFPGSWGSSPIFSDPYSGIERIPSVDWGNRGETSAPLDMATESGSTPRYLVTPSDRHAANDVGGRLDTTKQWRLSIPEPQGYSRVIASQALVTADPTTHSASSESKVQTP